MHARLTSHHVQVQSAEAVRRYVKAEDPDLAPAASNQPCTTLLDLVSAFHKRCAATHTPPPPLPSSLPCTSPRYTPTFTPSPFNIPGPHASKHKSAADRPTLLAGASPHSTPQSGAQRARPAASCAAALQSPLTHSAGVRGRQRSQIPNAAGTGSGSVRGGRLLSNSRTHEQPPSGSAGRRRAESCAAPGGERLASGGRGPAEPCESDTCTHGGEGTAVPDKPRGKGGAADLVTDQQSFILAGGDGQGALGTAQQLLEQERELVRGLRITLLERERDAVRGLAVEVVVHELEQELEQATQEKEALLDFVIEMQVCLLKLCQWGRFQPAKPRIVRCCGLPCWF